jgi:D-aspartate ligase
MTWPHIIVLDPYNAGLAVARRMTRAGAQVTVVEEEAAVGRSRGVRSIVAPFQATGEPWLEALLRIAATGAECAVLTGTDRGSAWLAGVADRLPANLLVFERPGSAHLALMDKNRADRIARAAGVRVPWTGRVHSGEELAEVTTEAPWPCVVKPMLSHEWRSRYGAARALLARDGEEAAQLMRRPLDDGLGMLLSQYIPGGDDDVEEAIVVRLADGSYPVRFGCRKLRQYPPGFGETAVGESSRLPETMTLARRVLDEAGFVGVAGVETKRHAETGERWFLEVNVRLPGQWGLGDLCGTQATPRLIASLCGAQLAEQPPLRPNVSFVQPDLDRHILLSTLRGAPGRHRPRVTWQLARPYIKARDLGMFDPRDPGPALALTGMFLKRRRARLKARLSRS